MATTTSSSISVRPFLGNSGRIIAGSPFGSSGRQVCARMKMPLAWDLPGQPGGGNRRSAVEAAFRAGLRYHEKIVAPGAHTERRGDAGPLRVGLAADTQRPPFTWVLSKSGRFTTANTENRCPGLPD